MAAAHAREAVDRDEHRRQQEGGHEQAHGPQRHHLAHRHQRVGRSAELERRRVVQGGERAQGRATEGLQPATQDRVAGRRRALAADRHERGRQVAGHERSLLAQRDGEGEPRPLRGRTRAARVGARLLAHGGLDGAAQLQRPDAVARRPTGHERPAHRRPGEVAEHEHRPGAPVQALGEIARAAQPGAAAAGRDEGHGALQPPVARHTRQLEHRRGARQLRAGAAPERVAVGHHHEARTGLADLARDDRGQAALAVGGLGLEGGRAHLIGTHRAEGGGQPGAECRIAAVARAARRIGTGPRVEIGLGARRREGVGLERGPDGAGTIAQRERAHDQRKEDRDEGCAVDPRVEHAKSAG